MAGTTTTTEHYHSLIRIALMRDSDDSNDSIDTAVCVLCTATALRRINSPISLSLSFFWINRRPLMRTMMRMMMMIIIIAVACHHSVNK